MGTQYEPERAKLTNTVRRGPVISRYWYIWKGTFQYFVSVINRDINLTCMEGSRVCSVLFVCSVIYFRVGILFVRPYIRQMKCQHETIKHTSVYTPFLRALHCDFHFLARDPPFLLGRIFSARHNARA